MNNTEIMAKLAELAKQQEELKKQLDTKNTFYKRVFGGGVDLGVLILDGDKDLSMVVCYYDSGDFGIDTENYDDYREIASDNWQECTKEEAITLWAKTFEKFVKHHTED